ncbi:MAG: hypothetical protein C7B45_06730 [Sulfobacillus acidophilus]|uniref:Uncharacterized protein n=1 Tax=Sulfobacillus acidophilus TaxID=53633 RepID=A0A2T2WJJ1_9FIRM|nr:MAG: hypothetical protein C7B45_06730 [Sulfobacillus acidophilus]
MFELILAVMGFVIGALWLNTLWHELAHVAAVRIGGGMVDEVYIGDIRRLKRLPQFAWMIPWLGHTRYHGLASRWQCVVDSAGPLANLLAGGVMIPVAIVHPIVGGGWIVISWVVAISNSLWVPNQDGWLCWGHDQHALDPKPPASDPSVPHPSKIAQWAVNIGGTMLIAALIATYLVKPYC